MRLLMLFQMVTIGADLIGFNRFSNTISKHRGGKLFLRFYFWNFFFRILAEKLENSMDISVQWN